MELDQSRIEAAVVQEVADRLVDEGSDLLDRIRKEVSRRIEQHFADVADAQIRAVVVDLGGALKDALRLELHETINRLLSETFNVRSLDDQGKRRSGRSIIQPVQAPTKPQAPGAPS